MSKDQGASADADRAQRRGYCAGLMGQPSLPGTYVEADRRAYEGGYDIGRRARQDEWDRI